MTRLVPHLAIYQIPHDALVACDPTVDVAARNPSRPRDPRRVAMRRRWTAVLHRRCRRVVRAVMRCRRAVRRGCVGWRAVAAYGGTVAVCAATQCRYHLADMYTGAALSVGCAIDVANRGGMSHGEVGALLGVSQQRVQQMERAALARRDVVALVERTHQRRPMSVEERVRAALADGDARTAEVVESARANRGVVVATLRGLVARGEAARSPGQRDGAAATRWWLLPT